MGLRLSKIEVIGLGALNIDHVFRVERILADGEAVVDSVLSSAGGSAANTIYGLARLGVQTGYWAKARSNTTPRSARASRFGVRTTGLPMNPALSARIWSTMIHSTFRGWLLIYFLVLLPAHCRRSCRDPLRAF